MLLDSYRPLRSQDVRLSDTLHNSALSEASLNTTQAQLAACC
jgi:hypothetical protein